MTRVTHWVQLKGPLGDVRGCLRVAGDVGARAALTAEPLLFKGEGFSKTDMLIGIPKP